MCVNVVCCVFFFFGCVDVFGRRVDNSLLMEEIRFFRFFFCGFVVFVAIDVMCFYKFVKSIFFSYE